jgi:pimeloyl-ACP methyl ester carboxylesterase
MTTTFHRAYIDCAFGQLHVTTDGRRVDGRQPLVLLNSRSRSLLQLLAHLRGRFYGVIIDIPGLGMSSPMPAGSSMWDAAASMLEVFDALAIGRAHLFGLHTGAKVAAAMAVTYPDRIERLVLAGKSHSIIADRTARNSAMKDYLAAGPLDSAIVQMEGRYLDDNSQGQGGASIYSANFAFDFAAAVMQIHADTMVLEIDSEEEGNSISRQGVALAELMPRAKAVVCAQTDPTGLDMYIGANRLAALLARFLSDTHPEKLGEPNDVT